MGDGEKNQHPMRAGSGEAARQDRRSRFLTPSLRWMRDLLVAVGLALVIIAFVYQPVKVEGTSMAPQLADQERIFINKFIYSLEPIQRGDIVVFRYPRDPSKSFIKRVVGLPGETIQIRRGVVYVNGAPLQEDYLNGDDMDHRSYPSTYLGPGHYFVLGDRRRSSHDSRSWGTVQRDYIYGKAVFAYWPLDHFGPIESGNGKR